MEDYFEVDHTSILFKHKGRSIWFTLVVDVFRIKYVGKEHIDNLLCILNKHCDMEIDYNGKLYWGITRDWNYQEGYVGMSMPRDVHKILEIQAKKLQLPTLSI